MQERDMKRSREQVRSLPEAGNNHRHGHAPAHSHVHIASPDSDASVVFPRDPRALEEKSNKTWRSRKGNTRTSKNPIVPFRPPPLVKPFCADSEGDGKGEVNSLSSPIDGQTAAPEPKPKRRRKDETEKRPEEEVWRKVAEGILAGAPVSVGEGTSKKSFAVVCSSNVNRSIMAQKLLEKNDMRAKSYGTGSQVKLPGKNSKSPQAFAFGTPYLEIYDSLVRLDEALFRRNSVLGLLQRDAVTKRAPEKWQALEGEEVASFDVVVCFESRVFDLVVEDLQQRDPETFKPLHIVSMTIRDSAEESAAAEGDVLELCKMLDACEDLNTEASSLLNGFRMKTKRTVLHQVCHI